MNSYLLALVLGAGCISQRQIDDWNDFDDDGETAVEADGTDCDDNDPNVNTQADEVC